MKNETWQTYADAEILARVQVRLITAEEKTRWDALICQRHYLGNADRVGRQLRYVAEQDGEWVALLGWNVAAYHLKGREEWLGWRMEQRLRRRKFVVQNSRYLLLVERGRYPNLASRVLSLCTRRLSADWEAAFGHPVLAVESFVDPERFSGACYRAAGWEALGRTQGYRRHHRDFYQRDGHPKELWVRALHPQARKWLSAEALPSPLASHEDAVPHGPYTVGPFRSLWELDQAVSAWMAEQDPQPLRRLAVDGKAIKGSRRTDGRPVHWVAAVSPDSLRLVAQRPVDEKSNEITALQPMLQAAPLEGVVVTADAMHAQQEAARFLQQEKGAEYFFTLKGNQPSIQDQAQRRLDGAFPPWASPASAEHREASRPGGNA